MASTYRKKAQVDHIMKKRKKVKKNKYTEALKNG